MRMRVLTHTGKGKLLAIADKVTRLIEADKATDVIPPAYPCDGERLVVIVATAKPSMPDYFGRFARSIKKTLAANVAFIIDGTPENAANIIEMTKTNDANVMDNNVLYIEGGLPFKFAKKVTPEEMQKVTEWVKTIRSSLK
jgi:hypothetical protein